MKNARFYYSIPLSIVKTLIKGTQNPRLDTVVEFYKSSIQPLSRITICGILNEDCTQLSFGVAVCSAKDRFIKKIGRELSYKRAITNPFKIVSVTKDNISDVRLNTCRAIEKEITRMNCIKF